MRQFQIDEIQTFQRTEIVRLAQASSAVAEKVALRSHYTCIGQWLPSKLGGRVLELGCGPGRYVALLAAMGYDVVGADPLSFPTWEDIRGHQQVEFQQGIRAEALPYADASFDHVACLGALLYFDNPDQALTEVRRVIKPGGRLFVRTVNRHNLVRLLRGRNIDPAAKNYYTESELAELLRRHGFLVNRTFSYGFYPPFAPMFWWYLVNGKIPVRAQEWLSNSIPPRYRVNIAAEAWLPSSKS